MFKKLSLIMALAGLTVVSLLSAPTMADTFTIDDATNGSSTYWGGVLSDGTQYYPSGGDVLSNMGTIGLYSVDSLTISRTVNTFTASVTGSYFSSGVSEYAGDLFLSTNGWHPYSTSGDSHFASDNSGNGEKWEYVLHLNTDHTLSLYAVESAKIILTDNIYAGGLANPWDYRTGQEVSYDTTGQTASAIGSTGSWNITGDTLTFSYALANGMTLAQYNLDGVLGVHWTMSCGNDVIEGKGGSEVPEPITLVLFGTGLLALSRARVSKKQ